MGIEELLLGLAINLARDALRRANPGEDDAAIEARLQAMQQRVSSNRQSLNEAIEAARERLQQG